MSEETIETPTFSEEVVDAAEKTTAALLERADEEKPLLDVRNLDVVLNTEDGRLPVITNLSFTMRKGETLAVVGESGCGKSMTALSVMGLLPEPVAKICGGSIDFQGTDLAPLDKEQRRKYRGKDISMIFQEPMTSLNPVMTAGRQIREGILVHNPGMDKAEADRRALEMIKLVGIPPPRRSSSRTRTSCRVACASAS